MRPPDGGPEFNRLIHENSPYLLQHARNPVDWFPWSEEAFARARDENRPIFLSIGYSTCHWCHVMERESFERADVAQILSEHYIAIKVDREERPEVDEIYMNATQLMTGRGGWPNSVWLTPDGRPWYAGTYFPPDDRFGQPGLKTLLLSLAEIWRTRPEEVENQASRLANALRQLGTGQGFGEDGELSRDVVQRAIGELRASFDPEQGGFGGAPKFPPHGALELILYEYGRTRDEGLLRMATRTLDGMSRGGIRDHVGGGFHRYSTDARWFLPDFEKMLYDNAQLSRIYVDAYRLTGEESFREIARQVYEWVLREMTDGDGGFYSALDADSEGEEGKFYLWHRGEILRLLGTEEGELFCRAYDVRDGGNFQNETTGHRPGTNVLHLERSPEDIARSEGLSIEEIRSRLDEARRKLLSARNERVWPHLDDKVLASWNGLMIGSFAYGGQHLGEAKYTAAAERAADFVLARMRESGRLVRTYRKGRAAVRAYLDDYAFLAASLLDLHEATDSARYLDEAKGLTDVLLEHYHAATGGGFFFTADDHENLLTRTKDPLDRAIPSGNGIAARVLVRLGHLTGETRYLNLGRGTLETFAGFMARTPRGTASLVLSTAMYLDGSETSGSPEAEVPAARIRRKPVTAEASVSQGRVLPGERLEVKVRIAVDKGWHINSNRPHQEHLVPTTIRLEETEIARVGEVVYPDGREVEFDFSPEPLSIYTGKVLIEVPVEISERAPAGSARLSLRVGVQPCDDRSCSTPEVLVLSVPVEVGSLQE